MYVNEDGAYGIENGNWCGCGNDKLETTTTPTTTATTTTTTTTTTTSISKKENCSKAILYQGYRCCSSNCIVIFEDIDGSWSFENGEWCGC